MESQSPGISKCPECRQPFGVVNAIAGIEKNQAGIGLLL